MATKFQVQQINFYLNYHIDTAMYYPQCYMEYYVLI